MVLPPWTKVTLVLIALLATSACGSDDREEGADEPAPAGQTETSEEATTPPAESAGDAGAGPGTGAQAGAGAGAGPNPAAGPGDDPSAEAPSATGSAGGGAGPAGDDNQEAGGSLALEGNWLGPTYDGVVSSMRVEADGYLTLESGGYTCNGSIQEQGDGTFRMTITDCIVPIPPATATLSDDGSSMTIDSPEGTAEEWHRAP